MAPWKVCAWGAGLWPPRGPWAGPASRHKSSHHGVGTACLDPLPRGGGPSPSFFMMVALSKNSTRTSLISLHGDTTGVSACLLPPTALHSLKQASLTVAVDSLTSRGPAGCRHHGTQAGVRELRLPLQQAQLPKERQCPPPLTTALRSPTEGISTAERS